MAPRRRSPNRTHARTHARTRTANPRAKKHGPLGRMVWLERERLDRGGYTSHGEYFGVGAPLFRFSIEGIDRDEHIRAADRESAKAKIRRAYPGVRFHDERHHNPTAWMGGRQYLIAPAPARSLRPSLRGDYDPPGILTKIDVRNMFRNLSDAEMRWMAEQNSVDFPNSRQPDVDLWNRYIANLKKIGDVSGEQFDRWFDQP